MSTNATLLSPKRNDTTPVLFLSAEQALEIILVFRRVLYPCMGVLGIAGAVASIVILIRQGFRKCSNILLLSLSVSNVSFLIGVNNISDHISASSDPVGFHFSKTVNYLCYIMYVTSEFAYIMGIVFGPLIPVLITGERLLAIFCPFTAYTILTPQRTIIILLCFYLITGPYCLYHEVLSVQLKTYLIKGVKTDRIVSSDMWKNHFRSGTYQLIENIFNYVTGIVPLCLVPLGGVVIQLKITHITNRRRRLTASLVNVDTRHGTKKTTKTLLKICLLYMLCYGFGFVAIFVLESKPFEQELPLRFVVINVQNMVLSVNCFGDFLIYVAANKRSWRSVIGRSPDLRV